MTHFEGRRINSPNDVAVAPDGTIWFTDPTFGIIMPNQGALADPELDHRSVYRFDPVSGNLGRMADFEEPNGLAFTADGRILYVSDTLLSLGEVPGFAAGAKHEIVAFDVGDGGTLSNRRFFCHTDHGYPDGFKVDARGWVWTSAADGVHVWSADRRKLGFIPTPASPRTARSAARTDGGSLSPRPNICWRSILPHELEEMPVGIANERIPVRRPDDARGRDVVGGEECMRPPGRLAIAEQLDMRRLVWRVHRQRHRPRRHRGRRAPPEPAPG